MRICIFGAGAIGSMYGGELARAGHDVTLITRGAHLAAIRGGGLRLRIADEERHTHPGCTDDPAEAGEQDLVIFTLKGHQVPGAAAGAAPLLGPKTTVVAAQNGIPWWYFHHLGGTYEGQALKSVDPRRKAWDGIGPGRVIGGVINSSCEVVEPGVVRHVGGSRALTLGEPDGSQSARLADIARAFADTDIDTKLTDDIRHALWAKLISNLAISQICVLTRSTLGEVNNDPGCFAVAVKLMREAQVVAGAVGVDLAAAVAARITGGPISLQHKPSTLQDLESGRKLEIDPMVGAVAEIGRLAGVPTPYVDAMYAMLRRLAEKTGCYFDNPAFSLDYST